MNLKHAREAPHGPVLTHYPVPKGVFELLNSRTFQCWIENGLKRGHFSLLSLNGAVSRRPADSVWLSLEKAQALPNTFTLGLRFVSVEEHMAYIGDLAILASSLAKPL